jgi:hypothetical protein
MRNYRKTILSLLANLLFCFVVVFLFGNYCFIRTAACPHLYKEYLSGVLALAMVYINALLIFPVLMEGRLRAYILWNVVCTFAFSFQEMAMVFPDVFPNLHYQFPDEAVKHFVFESFLVFLRTAAISASVFCVQVIPFLSKQIQNRDKILLKDFSSISAKDNDNKELTVHLNSISFFQQNKNHTQIYLADGSNLLRYGSLKRLCQLICADYAVQISRDTVVPYGNIKSFTESYVSVKFSPDKMDLFVTDQYKSSALKNLQNHVSIRETKQSEKKQPHRKTTCQSKKELQMQSIIDYISEHPLCPASDIQKYRRISTATVNRILAQLKQDGLIEYVGSKKTGGYRVVEKL